jgi:hypothetical protein
MHGGMDANKHFEAQGHVELGYGILFVISGSLRSLRSFAATLPVKMLGSPAAEVEGRCP